MKILGWLLLAALIGGWLYALHPVEAGGRASYVLVRGTSMEPTFRSGDLVITRKQPSYAIGNVVTFRVDDGKVIHRIVGGNGRDGYVLRGDNNAHRDPWRPTDQEVAGKLWLRLPGGAHTWKRCASRASWPPSSCSCSRLALPRSAGHGCDEPDLQPS